MKIRVLGCYGNVTQKHRTTAYLINDRVLFDAGAVTEALSPIELRNITHVVVSHIHLDHVKGLCFLAEQLSMTEDHRVTVAGDREVLECLSRYVFNDVLWPDFTAIPDRNSPAISLQTMHPSSHTYVAGLRVEVIPVHHRIHTTGFLIKEGAKTVMMTSDTGTTERIWEIAALDEDLKLIIAHVAFPSRLNNLAATAGHMTLSTLLERIDTYGLHHVPCYVAHMKSMFVEEIVQEIEKTRRSQLFVLKQDSVITV